MQLKAVHFNETGEAASWLQAQIEFTAGSFFTFFDPLTHPLLTYKERPGDLLF